MTSFESEVKRELAGLAQTGLSRRPKIISSSQGPEITIDGRLVVSLCSNNYLGLAAHPAIGFAISKAIAEFGIGAAGSRHVQGTMEQHKLAEESLSELVTLPAALLFSSGYAANTGSISALARSTDIIFSDELNHASIIDGCRLSRAKILIFRHLDLGHLSELLLKYRSIGTKALVISEALFSVDGDFSDLKELRGICDRFDAALVIDEAHSLGVYGPNGAGLCRTHEVTPDLLVGTLGKAFGVAGAFVAGAESTIDLIQNRARSYVFSTASPPALAAGVRTATDLVRASSDARNRVLTSAHRIRLGLVGLGYRLHGSNSQIISLRIGDPTAVMKVCADLLRNGVFIHGIRPPTVPPGTSRLRVTPIATHTDEHIRVTLNAFAQIRRSLRPDERDAVLP